MSFWTAIVAIVAIVAFANMRAQRLRHGSPRQGGDSSDAYTAGLEREVADLRKRLEVVERIVTDERETRRLSHEIESLRER